MRSCSRVILFALLTGPWTAIAQMPVNPGSYEELSPNADQLARTTGLLPLFEKLKRLQSQPGVEHVDLLLARQQILERVMGDALQVDATTARIDSEIAQANEYRNHLMDRRDRKENILNVASIATGGVLGVVGSALQISPQYSRAGNVVGIGSGVIVSALSVLSIRAQNGRREEFQFRSNMLAEMFDRPQDSTNVYTPAVRAFLNAVPLVDPDHLSRKQRLLRTWVQLGRLEALDSPKAQTKIIRLTGTVDHDSRVSISDLYDRRAMLDDLRAKLSLMKRDLASFLSSLPDSDNSAPIGKP